MAQNEILKEGMDRFQQIFNYNAKGGLNEITFLGNNTITSEDDEQDPNATPDGDTASPNGGATPDMGGTPADPNAAMGDDMSAVPASPNGGATPDMGDAPADPNAAMGGDMGGGQAPEGLDPQIDMSGAPVDPAAGDTEQPGDEVVDITDLTDSQEETEDKIEQIGNKFDEFFKTLGAFEELIKSNDQKIEDLKAEFEKRNPTQIEKLSMQTDKSYPFSVTPEEYWKEKEANSNYSTENDDNGKKQGQYVITKDDVDGDVDWASIANSLDDNNFMFGQRLDKLVKY